MRPGRPLGPCPPPRRTRQTHGAQVRPRHPRPPAQGWPTPARTRPHGAAGAARAGPSPGRAAPVPPSRRGGAFGLQVPTPDRPGRQGAFAASTRVQFPPSRGGHAAGGKGRPGEPSASQGLRGPESPPAPVPALGSSVPTRSWGAGAEHRRASLYLAAPRCASQGSRFPPKLQAAARRRLHGGSPSRGAAEAAVLRRRRSPDQPSGRVPTGDRDPQSRPPRPRGPPADPRRAHRLGCRRPGRRQVREAATRRAPPAAVPF